MWTNSAFVLETSVTFLLEKSFFKSAFRINGNAQRGEIPLTGAGTLTRGNK
jgi:hypothetical protein